VQRISPAAADWRVSRSGTATGSSTSDVAGCEVAGKEVVLNVQLLEGLAERVREIREDLFGPDGIRPLAEMLKLPPETWADYERGVVIPAGVILLFIEATGVDVRWLLTGEGHRYMSRHRRPDAPDML
jgi:hypothetical protein